MARVLNPTFSFLGAFANALPGRIAGALRRLAPLVLLLAAAWPAAGQAQSRIKDIANFEGIRENLLVGYGLVVGLNGTGDDLDSAPFTRESLIGMLQRLGINARDDDLDTANVAAVNVKEARPGDPGYDTANPGFYKGDNAKLNVRIDINATVEFGIKANDPGIEKLVRSLYMVRNANVAPGGIDRATLDSALGLVIEALNEIPDIRSRIGSDLMALEQMKTRHQDFTVFTNESISQIENVDVAAAVSRLSIDQTFLEASYMLTARLSQLSLANFLR